jgi:hypothetical protein
MDDARPFAIRRTGTDLFLLVHRGLNRMPNGRLEWVPAERASWFESREQADRFLRRLIGEPASIFDGRDFR